MSRCKGVLIWLNETTANGLVYIALTKKTNPAHKKRSKLPLLKSLRYPQAAIFTRLAKNLKTKLSKVTWPGNYSFGTEKF